MLSFPGHAAVGCATPWVGPGVEHGAEDVPERGVGVQTRWRAENPKGVGVQDDLGKAKSMKPEEIDWIERAKDWFRRRFGPPEVGPPYEL